MDQYETEKNYILNTYFGNFETISPFERIEGRPVSKCNALLNNIPYELYKYDLGQMYLIPKKENFFEGDFDNIYEILFIKDNSIHFSITRKKNGIIEKFYYDVILKNTLYYDSTISASLNYSSEEDYDNELEKEFEKNNIPVELFMARGSIRKMATKTNEKIIIIRRKRNNSLEKCVYNSAKKYYEDFTRDNMSFEKYDNSEDIPFLKIINGFINFVDLTTYEDNKENLKLIFSDTNK